MPSRKRIRALAGKLPVIRDWFEETVAAYSNRAIPLADLDLPRLGSCFPRELLLRAQAIRFSDIFPLPPLEKIGLDELSPSEDPATYEAMTYGNTIFLREDFQSEVLYFHELVHVIQWERLGGNNFLLAYITGLLESGYNSCPLEEMAFSLQERFRHGKLPGDVTARVHKLTDAVWGRLTRAYSLA